MFNNDSLQLSEYECVNLKAVEVYFIRFLGSKLEEFRANLIQN